MNKGSTMETKQVATVKDVINKMHQESNKLFHLDNANFFLFPEWPVCANFRAMTSLWATYTLNPIKSQI